MNSLTQLLSIEIRNSYTTTKLRNRTTTYSIEQEETRMLLSSAFKATAYKGFLLKGHLKRTKRQACDVETAEFAQGWFKNELGKVSMLSLQVCKSASLQVCRSASLQVCKSAGLQVCRSASLQSACVAHRFRHHNREQR